MLRHRGLHEDRELNRPRRMLSGVIRNRAQCTEINIPP